MKKLIVSLCAVAVGLCAQAATVSWSTGPVTGSNGALADDNNWDYGWTYAAVFSLYADEGGAKGTLVDTVNGTYDWGEFTGTSDKLELSTKYWVDAVITETGDGGNVTQLNIGPASFTTLDSASFDTQLNFTTGDGFTGGVSPMSGATWGGGGSGGVPEPTSGLLLLVGGAMLALRRKQK